MDEKRILIKEAFLKSTTNAFVKFKAILSNETTTEKERTNALDKLTQCIEEHEFATKKMQILENTFAREANEYSKRADEIKGDCMAVQSEIAILLKELEAERIARNNKEEYAALAKLINTLPPRSQFEARLQTLQNQQTRLQDEAQKLEEQRAMRERQFSVLLQAVGDLQTQFE